MPTDILMPALSPTMEEGKLAKWMVKEGDSVAPGDVLAEIETDKATMEVEAVDEGTIGKILVEEGTDNVKVNTPIAALLGEDEDADDIAESKGDAADKADDAQDDADEKSDAEDDEAAEDMADKSDKKSSDKKGGGKASPERPAFTPQADPDLPEGVEMVETTMREALRDAMAEEMRRDDKVYLMGEEVAEYEGAYKVTQGLLAEFGAKRIVDTPITEHGFAGLGVGAAFAGLRPIVEFMTWNFGMQAIDQIINSAAKQLYMSGGQISAPMVFRGPNGAASRVGAQHSQDYTAWYSHVPGLIVIAPYSPADAKGLLKAAIRDPNPVIFLENELLYGTKGEIPDYDDFVLPIGKARIAREGRDVTIVSYSMGMRYATEAAEKLVDEGVDVELIDLRTIRPMDLETVIESVKKTGRCVTVEEGWPQNSVGSYIAAMLMEHAFDYLDAPVMRVTGKDVPLPYAANLEKLALPNSDDVIEAVNAVTYR